MGIMDIIYKFKCGCYLQSLGGLGVALMIECDLHKFNKEARAKLKIPKKDLIKINKKIRAV